MYGLGLPRTARHAHDHAVARAVGGGEGEQLAVVAEGGGAEAAGVGGDGAGGARLGQLQDGEVDAAVDGEPPAIG